MKEDIGICNRKKITDFQGIHILKTYLLVGGFKLRNTYRAYGGENVWLCNIYAYGCL